MAKGLNAPRRAAGFTLVELMIASLIFSMVIAGFAAIYSTAFSQSGQVLREARLKSNGLISFKSIAKQMATATRVDFPPINNSGTAVTGCANMAPDSTQHVAGAVSAFGFCIQTGAVGQCQAYNDPNADRPAPCLFSYSWTSCPPPALTGGNCGTIINSAAPTLLSTRVLRPNGAIDPDCNPFAGVATPDYFVRGGNDVRVRFRMCRPASGRIQLMGYDSETVAHGHFDSRL